MWVIQDITEAKQTKLKWDNLNQLINMRLTFRLIKVKLVLDFDANSKDHSCKQGSACTLQVR